MAGVIRTALKQEERVRDIGPKPKEGHDSRDRPNWNRAASHQSPGAKPRAAGVRRRSMRPTRTKRLARRH